MEIETITKVLEISCYFLVILVVVVLILIFRSTPEKYSNKPKKRNKVDDEIEKELRNNTK